MKRRAAWTAIALGGACAVIGVGAMHAKIARSLGVGCPMRASAADVERGRAAVARSERTDRDARERFALGFRLDGTTLDDARSWAAASHVACEDEQAGAVLRCADVDARALGDASGAPVDELVLAFAGAKLVNVSAWRRSLAPSVADDAMRAIRADLGARLGEPTRAAPDATALAYRFKDYAADVSAAEIPGRGVFVREHYMSATD